jgi:hypothetical protein
MNRIFKFLACLAVFGIFLTGCSTVGSSEGSSGFSVKLVDAPGDYEKVLIDVQAIEILLNGETFKFPVAEPGIYDLLELTGGVSAMLVETIIPAGELSQIKLILGEENYIVNSEGEYIGVKTPSAQQAGLNINIQQDLEAGILYDFILDFNVEKSIVVTGNSDYLLKPVIRASLEAQSGAITGVVRPGEGQNLVTASTDGTEVAAYTVEDTGVFYLYGVPEDAYKITVTPEPTSAFSPVTVKNVVVKRNAILDLGTIEMK